MTTWNYRVMRHRGEKSASIPIEQEWTDIREVYYGDDGAINGWTAESCHPIGENDDELRHDVVLMVEALAEPILNEWELPGAAQ